MSNYSYNDLVYIERGNSGDITTINVKIVPINEIISEITSNIKNSIDNTSEVYIQVDMGKITGVSWLTNVGPKCGVKTEIVRTA